MRKTLGLVQQEPTLFNYSIRDNIAYGDVDCTEEAIQKAATIANAHEFIEKLESIDTEEPL